MTDTQMLDAVVSTSPPPVIPQKRPSDFPELTETINCRCRENAPFSKRFAISPPKILNALNLNVPDGPNTNPTSEHPEDVNQETFLEYLRTKNLTVDSTISELLGTFPCIESVTVTTYEGNKEPEIKSIPSSSLEMKDMGRLFNVHIGDDSLGCSWDIPDSSGEPQAGTRWLETVLGDLESSEAWRFARAAVVHLIIFDRLTLVGGRAAAKKLRIVRECPMTARVSEAGQDVTSCLDYVLGYGGTGRKDIEIGLVALELRKRHDASELSPQLICYMVGLQQKQLQRKGKRVSIYGIQTDGADFLFVRLDGDGNVQTAPVPGGERSRLYRYIDVILDSVISSSPYGIAGKVETGIEYLLDSISDEIVPQVMMGHFDGYEYIIRHGEDGQLVLAQVEEDCEVDED